MSSSGEIIGEEKRMVVAYIMDDGIGYGSTVGMNPVTAEVAQIGESS